MRSHLANWPKQRERRPNNLGGLYFWIFFAFLSHHNDKNIRHGPQSDEQNYLCVKVAQLNTWSSFSYGQNKPRKQCNVSYKNESIRQTNVFLWSSCSLLCQFSQSACCTSSIIRNKSLLSLLDTRTALLAKCTPHKYKWHCQMSVSKKHLKTK